jgi:hypothetical protein
MSNYEYSVLEKASLDVVSNIYDENDKQQIAIDPITMAMIANLIIQVIKLLVPIIQRWCNRSEDVVATAKNPGIWARMMVRWKVRQELRKDQYKNFNVVTNHQLEQAIFRTFAKKNVEEVETIIQHAIYER